MALKHKKHTSHHYHGLLTPAVHGAVTQKAHLPPLAWATNTTSDTQENMSTQGPTRQVRPTTQHKPVDTPAAPPPPINTSRGAAPYTFR